jgi:hypothetical protein
LLCGVNAHRHHDELVAFFGTAAMSGQTSRHASSSPVRVTPVGSSVNSRPVVSVLSSEETATPFPRRAVAVWGCAKPDPNTAPGRVFGVYRSESPRHGTRDCKAVMVRIILPQGAVAEMCVLRLLQAVQRPPCLQFDWQGPLSVFERVQRSRSQFAELFGPERRPRKGPLRAKNERFLRQFGIR